MRGPKDRAHAATRRFCATQATAIAELTLGTRPILRPAQRKARAERRVRQDGPRLGGVGRGRHAEAAPQRPTGPGLGQGDDLAGVEQMTRIEDGFYLTQHRIERAVLAGHPRRSRQAGAVLAAHRAAQVERQLMDVLGQGEQTGHVLRLAQIEERSRVNLAGRRVDQERRRRLVLL